MPLREGDRMAQIAPSSAHAHLGAATLNPVWANVVRSRADAFRVFAKNDTPGASRARAHKERIAVVEAADGVIRFSIIEPGRELLEVVDRSLALGTWGAPQPGFMGGTEDAPLAG